MKNRDLLKEAIADAKAVKETAIANAKLALEESFAPYLKEKLSAKLAEMDEEEEEAKVSENARTDAEEEGYKDGMKDEKEDMEEMSNPVMRRGLKGDDSTEYETEMMRDKEGMDEEMDLDELLAELDKELNEDARTDAEEEGYLDGMKDEKEDMDKMKKEIKELRSDLHETNLLNTKLLYTNKIFRAKNLKEAQKVKVLEAFDKASNVKEVKLIFETLNEGMVANATTATPIRENLGRASKAAGMAPRKQPIMEIDPQVARWQKLAGIK